MSGLPTHLEGDGENVCSINGPKVRQGVMRGTEFREEFYKMQERSRKISVLHPSSFGLNSEF